EYLNKEKLLLQDIQNVSWSLRKNSQQFWCRDPDRASCQTSFQTQFQKLFSAQQRF
ncbi:hypothetical protein M9458_053585, partial [Cirrhinus mrigala]